MDLGEKAICEKCHREHTGGFFVQRPTGWERWCSRCEDGRVLRQKLKRFRGAVPSRYASLTLTRQPARPARRKKRKAW